MILPRENQCHVYTCTWIIIHTKNYNMCIKTARLYPCICIISTNFSPQHILRRIAYYTGHMRALLMLNELFGSNKDMCDNSHFELCPIGGPRHPSNGNLHACNPGNNPPELQNWTWLITLSANCKTTVHNGVLTCNDYTFCSDIQWREIKR